jgi:hypothetical protein
MNVAKFYEFFESLSQEILSKTNTFTSDVSSQIIIITVIFNTIAFILYVTNIISNEKSREDIYSLYRLVNIITDVSLEC